MSVVGHNAAQLLGLYNDLCRLWTNRIISGAMQRQALSANRNIARLA
jgi:hypothetical protein